MLLSITKPVTLLRALCLSMALCAGLLCTVFAQQPPQEAGVCARVRIKLSQEVALTRTAFKATLDITNAPENVRLENVAVTIDIRSKSDVASNDLFGIRPPELTGISDVSGSGTIEPGTNAKAVWIMIPTHDAAPDAPTQYYVGGTLAYTQGGSTITMPLFPATITVKPDPILVLRYFLVRDVYSDDPFTPQVEPAEPFPLGLLLINQGKGTANNVRIISSQPQIVDNEKGLLIDFKIIGTQVNTDAASPSLSVNLGNVPPGQTSVAKWMMTSSLQGKFIEYKATFEHVDDLGDPRLSLIDNVSIHELTHAVRVDDPVDDGKPDFLVNDVADPDHLPDTLYNSDGTTAPVNLGLSPSIDGPVSAGHLQVHLQATVPGGWIYIKAPDPGQEQFRLTRVVRSDGREVRVDDNAWTTHRTIRLVGQAPYREHLVHIFDNDSTGSYTLIYEEMVAGEVSIGQAKLRADGQEIALGGTQGLAVTALFPESIYLEALDRTSGIKAMGASAFEGDRVSVKGKLGTDTNGERYIAVSQLTRLASWKTNPLGLNLRAFWGGSFDYDAGTGVGQIGTTGGAGLNPVGLYVRTVGKVVSPDSTSFLLSDGTNTVKVLLSADATPPTVDANVRVDGIVTMEKVGGELHPVIRIRRADDVYAYNTGPIISDVQVANIQSAGCDISWSTDRMSSSVVKIGTASGVYDLTVNGPDFVQGHTVHLNGLIPLTKYYFTVQSKDYYTNITTTSTEQSFTTADMALPVLSLTFPSASRLGGTVTATGQLTNTGGVATEVTITGIQASPTSVAVLTGSPLTFGTGNVPAGGTASQNLQFSTTATSFYAKVTFTYKDGGGTVRALTTPWKKIVVP